MHSTRRNDPANTLGTVMSIKTIEQIRNENYLFLFEQFKEEIRRSWPAEPDRGMLRRFAQRIGISPISASQHKNGKVIGTKMANRIEDALKLPEGWMDTDHAKESAEPEDGDLAAAMDAFRGMYEHSPEATRAALVKVMGAIVTGKPIESIVDAHKK